MRDEWEWIFTVPANRDLFSLEVGEEKEDIRSVIESMFFLPPMDRMHTDISDVVADFRDRLHDVTCYSVF